MNRILLSVLLISIMTAAKAQIPQQLNYQGIARNSSGSPITYQNIKVRISLIDSATGGQLAYSETRKVMTNYVGLFNILIGSPGATSVFGRMQDVNWLTGRKYIKLEIDPSGLTNFMLAGITELQSVPYALSAGSAAASGNAGGDLAGTYPSPTIANGVITSNKLADGSISLSKLEASVATLLANKLNASDTAAMLSQYARKADVDAQVAGTASTFETGTDGTDFNVSSSGTAYTFNIPDASATARGAVTITDQVFNGKKTFSSDLMVNGLTVGKGLGQNDQNTAFGREALGSGTGTRNTAIGYAAMKQYSGTSFDNNTSIGYSNFVRLTTGHANTSVGAEAMMALTTGAENTAIGQQTLIWATGNENTALGSAAGNLVTSGSGNTFLGRGANVSTGTFSNATAIGYLAIVDASNKIQLGNSSVTSVGTSGKLTTGAVTYPNTDGQAGQVLTTNGSGSASWSAVSVREAADEFTATAAQTSFTLTQTPSAGSKVKMYVNGIRISNTAYSVSGTTLTYNAANNGSYSLSASDRIQFDYLY